MKQFYAFINHSLVQDLLFAIVAGIISGVVFFLILRIFVPKIKISDKIVKTITKNENGDDLLVYRFKFFNSTWSDVENVSIDLFLMEDFFHGSAKNYKTKKLKIAQSEFKYLTGKKNKNKEIHNNCVQMRILGDLEDEWNGAREWLHVQIDVKHSKSGRRKVYVKTFKDPAISIVNGKFDSGENFNIIS